MSTPEIVKDTETNMDKRGPTAGATSSAESLAFRTQEVRELLGNASNMELRPQMVDYYATFGYVDAPDADNNLGAEHKANIAAPPRIPKMGQEIAHDARLLVNPLECTSHEVRLYSVDEKVVACVKFEGGPGVGPGSTQYITPKGTTISFKLSRTFKEEKNLNDMHFDGLVVADEWNLGGNLLAVVKEKTKGDFPGATSPMSERTTSGPLTLRFWIDPIIAKAITALRIESLRMTYATGSAVTNHFPALLNRGGKFAPTNPFGMPSKK